VLRVPILIRNGINISGFTVVEKAGHRHHFGVATDREQRRWTEAISAIVNGQNATDYSQYDRSALLKIFEVTGQE